MDKTSPLWSKFESWLKLQKIEDKDIKLYWECFLWGALAQKRRQEGK